MPIPLIEGGTLAIIVAEHLTKRFEDLVAVDDVSFAIREGECFGFLGPNGAGKTTTMRMIQCVSPVTSGSLTVAGMDVVRDERAIKSTLGVAPQEDNLDPDLSVRENLLMHSRYFDIPRPEAEGRADELLGFFQLEQKASVDIDKLSGGMKRRLVLARALINRPRILILDEPTTGLDPQARHLIWDRLRQLRAQGSTIILTTHYMDEAERLCDRLVVMDNGKVLEEGSPRDLIKRHVGESIVEVQDGAGVLDCVRGIEGARSFETEGGMVHVSTEDPQQVIGTLLRECGVVTATVRRATLEDVFLKLTGRRLRE
jgi:lipooligosaccharide transport system ATP-binding protein